jgi:hypothetical protein
MVKAKLPDEEKQTGRTGGCSAYTTPSSCNAGSGCGWDAADGTCYASCGRQTTETGCDGLRGEDGAQRCLWADGKCSKKVIAQCTPLWADPDGGSVGVVAGSGYQKMTPGQVVIIIIVSIAVLIILLMSFFGTEMGQRLAGRLTGGGGGGAAAAAGAP